MLTDEFKVQLKVVKSIRKKLSKVRVGLPNKVEFHYSRGVVECYPKERKWIVKLNGKLSIIHYMTGRNDVTKYKAKRLLKLAIIGLLRKDK